ncbi:helicase HerA domain-containing protein [Pseudonocardia sichuanensis]
MAAPTLLPLVTGQPRLPEQVVAVLARLLASQLDDHGVGHCLRVDSVRRGDAARLAAALSGLLPPGSTDVHVLADHAAQSDGVTIPAERAIELRNRKLRRLVLLVPVGSGSAASSLDNSFARVDITALLAEAGEQLLGQLDGTDVADGVRRVARELGRSRPVEAWARYLATVAEDPTWTTAGAALWIVGLVPDLGGAELVGRLPRNVACVRAISRPSRAVASVADRLTTAELQECDARDRIARYLSSPDVDLSDAASWAAPLAGPSPAGLSFEHWPLVERRTVELTSVRLDPFLKDDGTLRPGTRLHQENAGDLPYVETGEGSPGSVTLTWRTDPVRTDAVDRWLLEALPPEDLREPDTEPLAKQTVKGDKTRGTVRLDIAEEDLTDGALLVVRLTALDSDGQPVRLLSGDEAVDESQQFAVRWEDDPLPTSGRRASSRSLAQARLDAALEGQDDHREGAPQWGTGGNFELRLGGRRTVQLALSPALTDLQRRSLAERGRVMAWEADGRLGEVLDSTAFSPLDGSLPPTFAERRRHLFGRLGARKPRDVVETLAWDDELRQEVATYCQSYRRALDSTTDPGIRSGLLALDTVRLSVDTVGHPPIAATLVLPLHPMRLAWAAEFDATLTRWAGELADVGRSAVRRRQSVDARLVRRVTPANLPFAVRGVDGLPFVYVREATLGTGVYLHADEAEPGAAVQAVFEVLGLDRRDVPADLPPSAVAERVAAYRAANPGQDALRVLASNAGSGELLARALAESVLSQSDDEDGYGTAPARLDLTAYSRRPSYTDPVPALTDLQRAVASQEVRGVRSHLTPPLGVSVRPHERLATDTGAAHLGIVSDLAVTELRVDDAPAVDAAASFRNLLTPAPTRRAADAPVWRTAPALRARNREGAADVVEAHRAYQTALGAALEQGDGLPALTARLGASELASLRAAHDRADWVLTLDRNLGLDLYTSGPEYILDYAPDFLDGLGPRLTVTTAHRGEVERLLADAMGGLDLMAEENSVRSVLDHLQVVSGRLALRLVARSSLATEAVGLAVLMAHLRQRGELDGTIVVPVDAHQEVFGDNRSGDEAVRRCDVLLVRTTARTVRIDCVEVKTRRATALPIALVDDMVDQLDATVDMLHTTFFRTDPPRIDAELQRARLGGILRHHADRALAMGLLDERRRTDVERLVERVEDGVLVPEIARRGYVVNLGDKAGLPAEHRGVPIHVLSASDLGAAGFTPSRREGARAAEPITERRPSPRPRPATGSTPLSSTGASSGDGGAPGRPSVPPPFASNPPDASSPDPGSRPPAAGPASPTQAPMRPAPSSGAPVAASSADALLAAGPESAARAAAPLSGAPDVASSAGVPRAGGVTSSARTGLPPSAAPDAGSSAGAQPSQPAAPAAGSAPPGAAQPSPRGQMPHPRAADTSPLPAVTPPAGRESVPGAASTPPRPSPHPRTPAAGGQESPAVEPPPAVPVEALPQVVDVVLGQDRHAADVRWRISTAGSPHLFVLGIPGQGKSVTTRRILNSFAEQGLPALVLDFHGDMAAAPAGGAAVLDASQGLPISPFELDNPRRYREAAWELSEVIGYVCGLGEIQRNVVYEGVCAAYEKHGYGGLTAPTSQPTMDELAAAVAEVEGTGRGRNVVARLRPLSDFGLFTDDPGQTFADLLRRGLVLDIHGLMEQVQVAAGAFVLRKVYREMFRWGQTGQLRLAVVLDEAHRLARDVTLPKIMKEGRKYGVAVVVASQGVDDFHKDVLSNAGTKVAFRCNYPQSRTVAGFLRGRDGQDMSAALEQLAVGQAYVSTPEQAAARKVFMARD